MAAIVQGGQSAVLSALLDPETCGEDLAYNAGRVTELAPVYCQGCADYHLAQAAKRLSGRSWWSHGARGELIRILHAALDGYIRKEDAMLDVVIAGAGETGVVSTSAHAVAVMVGADLVRTRFTVLDKCRTPLALCADYASRNGLILDTRVADFLGPITAQPADVVILHSVLNFIPEDMQVSFLKTLGDWLKPGGRIVCWNSLAAEGEDRHRDERRREEAAAATQQIFAASESGADVSRWTAARPGAPRKADLAPIAKVYRSAGLEIERAEEVTLVMPLSDGRPFERKYSVVVAGRHTVA